jgi:hypothetical protein
VIEVGMVVDVVAASLVVATDTEAVLVTDAEVEVHEVDAEEGEVQDVRWAPVTDAEEEEVQEVDAEEGEVQDVRRPSPLPE